MAVGKHRGHRILTLASIAAAIHLAMSCAVPAPDESGLTKDWCSLEGDLLTVDGDGTFTLEHISARYVNNILHDDGYVEGYRLQTEYGGVVPTTAAGEWTLQSIYEDFLNPRKHIIELRFSSFDENWVSEWSELAVNLDTEGSFVLVAGRDPSRGTVFATCASPTPSTQSGRT